MLCDSCKTLHHITILEQLPIGKVLAVEYQILGGVSLLPTLMVLSFLPLSLRCLWLI